jgi:ATP-dependent exoDNAse (exonuclease V) alpha subunit
MAIYHCSVKTISRGQGRSAVGAAAYRSGEKIENEYDGLVHDYTHKKGIDHTEIIAPDNAPEWAKDRAKLWNEVEKAETRKNSRTAREVEVALPKELTKEQQKSLVEGYARENFVDHGMVADIAIHDKGDGNTHAHILLTTREIDQNGFTAKNRDWDKKESLEQWRENWSKSVNRELERAGHEVRIDHRSHQDRGLEQQPTIHIGVTATAMERKGIETDRGNINRQITANNKAIEEAKQLEQGSDERKPEERQRGDVLEDEINARRSAGRYYDSQRDNDRWQRDESITIKELQQRTEKDLQKQNATVSEHQRQLEALAKAVEKAKEPEVSAYRDLYGDTLKILSQDKKSIEQQEQSIDTAQQNHAAQKPGMFDFSAKRDYEAQRRMLEQRRKEVAAQRAGFDKRHKAFQRHLAEPTEQQRQAKLITQIKGDGETAQKQLPGAQNAYKVARDKRQETLDTHSLACRIKDKSQCVEVNKTTKQQLEKIRKAEQAISRGIER